MTVPADDCWYVLASAVFTNKPFFTTLNHCAIFETFAFETFFVSWACQITPIAFWFSPFSPSSAPSRPPSSVPSPASSTPVSASSAPVSASSAPGPASSTPTSSPSASSVNKANCNNQNSNECKFSVHFTCSRTWKKNRREKCSGPCQKVSINPPPPRFFKPQLQIMCCYYVKNSKGAGGRKCYMPTKGGGEEGAK